MSNKLGEYIKERLEQHNMSGRAAAAAMGSSPAYFSHVLTGKVERPGLDFCKKLAELFNDPPAMVLRLAGWFEDSDKVIFRQEVLEMAERAPRFRELVRSYENLGSEGAREAFLTAALATLNAIKQATSEED